jgi:hypothetical protein
MSNTSILRELWDFLRVRKKWWLLPVLVVLFLVGTLLVFAQTSALAPFIYTIFWGGSISLLRVSVIVLPPVRPTGLTRAEMLT